MNVISVMTIFLCSLIVQSSAENIKEYIMTTFCAVSERPVKGHGAVVRWDGLSSEPQEYTISNEPLIDCSIIFEVDPVGFPGLEVWSSLHFRTGFRVMSSAEDGTGASTQECDLTFMQLYDPHDAPNPQWTICTDSERPTDYESRSQMLRLRLFANFTNDDNSNVSSSDAEHPEIYFNIDFTTFAPDCEVDKFDDLIKCSTSKRCIHTDVICDRFASRNCWSPSGGGDISDQTSGSPAYCDEEVDLLPLWIVLGLLGGVLLAGILYWCFWRPGWIPWRCARLRNWDPCTKCCKRGRCGEWSSRSKACRCCRGNTSSQGVSGTGGGKHGNVSWMNGANSKQNAFGGVMGWQQFHAGDGFHLTENRY